MTESEEIDDKVRVSQGSIQLPTYTIRGENRNPVFRSQYGVAHIYPYTLLDDISSQPVEKTYHTLVLENRYLRVTVMVELGGRVYSVFDKLSKREVFYKNEVVKFSPLAIRGAFFSGGVEFSFPVAHAPTTADPVNWDIRENKDGSASVSFGGIEHISRLRWMITLTLFPNRCALAQDVQLYNPTAIPGRYHYWTNASLDADDKTEFVYPLRRARSYEFAGTSSWPAARLDLILKDPGLPGMEGVPMWPAERMQAPVNFRHQKNMLAQVSIFGRDVAWDFFGAWQHSVNYGYAHYADHRYVSGMKLWSWGNAEVGVVNQTALTDDGSVYAETQCGAMETQLDFAFLEPTKMRYWREWWIPLRGLGGLTCASAEVGARIHLSPAKAAGEVELTVGLCPVRTLNDARVELSIPGKTLLAATTTISPEKPWLAKQIIAARDLADHPIRILVQDQMNQSILDYSLDRDPSPVEPYTPEIKSTPQTSKGYYQLGLKHENFDNREQALQAYLKSIELSPENKEAQFHLGLMLLRAANFSKAREHFIQALSLGLVESNYYLGILSKYMAQLEEARKFFLAVPAGYPLSSAALLELGIISLHEKDFRKATSIFEKAHLQDKQSISASLFLGFALLRNGQAEEARGMIRSVLELDPLNHPALREMSLLEPDGPHKTKLARMLEDDRQYNLDLACYYINVGLLKDALLVIKDAAQKWEYPILFYLAAYLCSRIGDQKEVQGWLQKATHASPEYVFPSRLEEVLSLEYALKQVPQDHNAKYYLGNFLYAHQRYEEGVRLWQEAAQGLTTLDVLYRNLGLAAWQRDKNIPLAIELFEKALRLNPQNQDLYLHLDDLYKAQGLDEQRQHLLTKINALEDAREDVHKRSIQILVELGRYEEALQIMQTEKFVPLEMDQSFHTLYVQALMKRAEGNIKSGQLERAVADYKRALEYPSNLGVGKPTTMSQAPIYYHLGLALEKLGLFQEALASWRCAASEHHPHGAELFPYVQMSLDKLSRYSELGLDG